MEDFLRACHDTVKDAEPKKLASQMGLPHVSLLQRSNPDNDAHRLTINHLFQILLHSGDMRPLAALASEFGFDLVKRGDAEPRALMASLINAGKEVADLTLAVHQALEDSHVSQVEKAAIKREIAHVRESLEVMEASVRVA